ncbi:quercetin dioxygenase-like cupin family protein [Antricoccus suffuscus]|uniref:Quercetin dioxygenase-like cupin family protein n=1 Tax=Antricoccus suffuscus TaxID=1629062 RepID=A0A2T0ZFU0_9ACTN|nr:cupin domain-containing protein [Antricoccus suffuscus]PRZ35222.1 quercetin dioxygenase-like cupin family protein [Antricoccus suffuscus]
MEPLSLTLTAEQQIAKATSESSGRSVLPLKSDATKDLRQLVVALRAGSALSEHENPGEAVVQSITGHVTLSAGDESWELFPGNLIAIPQMRHELRAVTDSAVLLTLINR